MEQLNIAFFCCKQETEQFRHYVANFPSLFAYEICVRYETVKGRKEMDDVYYNGSNWKDDALSKFSQFQYSIVSLVSVCKINF